jgi:hypothetical protein
MNNKSFENTRENGKNDPEIYAITSMNMVIF